jgi:hypothetical protein
VDHKKQKTENGSNGAAVAEEDGEEEEDAEEEEDIDGEEEEDVDGEGEEDLDEEEGGEGEILLYGRAAKREYHCQITVSFPHKNVRKTRGNRNGRSLKYPTNCLPETVIFSK